VAQVGGPLGDLSGHVIICGAEDSFVNFVAQLVRTFLLPSQSLHKNALCWRV
jgi:hypothetical protein